MSSSGLSVVLAIILYLVGSAFGGNPGEPGPGVPVSGEVTASRATVRAGPGTSFPPVTVVEASTPVRITGRQGDWYRVELSGGLAGWMWGPLLRLKPQLPAPAPLPQSPFAGPSVIGYYLHDPRRTGLLASLRGTLEAISVWAWRLTPDGQLAWEIDPQEMSRVASLARSLGMQMYALVHNFQGDAFDADLAHAVLTDLGASRQAVQQIARQAARLQLAGITLDLENVRPADRQALARFVRELAAALHGQGIRLAVAVPARTRDLPADAYDYGALGSTADQLWLMTYDQHYRTGPPGPVASVEWVEQVVRYAVSRVAPSRVVLGLPAYGYAWQEGAPQARGLTYAQAMAELRSSGATLRWHPVHRTPYFVTSQGTQVWFEDRFSAAFKLALVRRYRLGGVAVWRLGQEDPGLWELVRRL